MEEKKINQVIFERKEFNSRTKYNVATWLKKATVGGTVVLFTEPKEFFKKLEELKGFIKSIDLIWVNELCLKFLGRVYNNPIKSIIPKIKIGTDANNTKEKNYSVIISKAAPWKKNGMERIYFDYTINEKEGHCYFDAKNGSFYATSKNKGDLVFDVLEPHFLRFVGLTSKSQLKTLKEVKVA